MKKYLITLALEIFAFIFFLFIIKIHIFTPLVLVPYIIIFPLIYLILTLIDIKSNWNKYFVGYIPILFNLLMTFIKDGTTTYQSNPDSSIFGWFIFFNIIRCMISTIGLLIIVVIHKIFENKYNYDVRNL